jgi:hypothetical protein
MGYMAIKVNTEEITTEKLEAFDVIITGIRAYNVLPLLSRALLNFVKSGKPMMVNAIHTTAQFLLISHLIHLKFLVTVANEQCGTIFSSNHPLFELSQ